MTLVAAGSSEMRTSMVDGGNVFVEMSTPWRVAIVVYIFVWQISPPVLSNIIHGTSQGYIVWRFLLALASQLLLMLPFMLRKLAGVPTGWLHPLVFPVLISLAISLVRAPSSLLHPLLVWSQPMSEEFYHPLLIGWSESDLSAVHLKAELLSFIALLSAYCGFLMIKMPVPRLGFHAPRALAPKFLVLYALLLILFLWLLESSGGLIAHITRFGQGRQYALDGVRHIAGLINFAPLLLILWYVFDATIAKKPWYLALLVFSLAMQFMTTGSRSSTVMPLILFLAVWIFHHKRIPATRVALLGLAGLLAVGVLGQIRSSTQSGGELDVSSLMEFELEQAFEVAMSDIEMRNRNSGALPTIAKVPHEVELLFGESYVAALTFFVPSALWEGKPRGAGAYTGAMIFNNLDLEAARTYSGAGRPPGAVAEAFWNFHIPGVIVIFFAFGVFRRWLAELLIRYEGQPAVIGFYLFSIYSVGGPASTALNPYFRNTVLLIALFYFLGTLRGTSREKWQSTLRSQSGPAS